MRRGARRAREHVGALLTAALLVGLGASAASLCATVPAADAKAASGCRDARIVPNGHNGVRLQAATLCLMNKVRVAHGLRPLRANRALAAIASGQARDMVRGDYFGDQSLSGKSPLTRIMASHYPAHTSSLGLMTAQNIGWGTGPNATPTGILRAWMESPPHRRIILTGSYRDAGVGVAASVPFRPDAGWLGGTYAVEFGRRRR